VAFLNEKEDVIEIQLTQYGKHLLSRGKFNPSFYAFFDDNIIYDAAYAGITEHQNNIEGRIKDAPQLNAQYVYSGIETSVKRDQTVQPTTERHYALSAPLGNSSLHSSVAPSWKIQFLKNDVNGYINYISSDHQTLRIPQISSSINFETVVGSDDIFQDETDVSAGGKKYEDGTYIRVKEDYIVVEVSELDVPFEKENYDIEVFLVESVADTKIPTATREQLIPLTFATSQDEQNLELDSSYVEYYIDISLDNEIDESVLNDLRGIRKSSNIYSDPLEKMDEMEEDAFDIPLEDDFEACE